MMVKLEKNNPRATKNDLQLPDLNFATFGPDTLIQLIHDIESCGDVIEVVLKHESHGFVHKQDVTLEKACNMLLDASILGAQIRYKYNGEEWWDTIMLIENGFKLVRISHN